MSFTWTRKMPSYHYAGNDAYIKLTNTASDVYAVGSREQLALTITPASTLAGDTITIKALAGDIVFTCVAALTGVKGEYIRRSGFASDALFMTALVDAMNSHYELHQLFFAENISNTLYLFSAEFGQYTLTPYASTTGAAYSAFTHSIGVAPSVVSNFRHRIELFRRDANNENVKICEELRLPTTAGLSIFNLRDYLGRQDYEYFKWIATTEVVNRTLQILQYRSFAGENVNNTSANHTFKTIPGKLRDKEFEVFYNASTDSGVSTEWDSGVWLRFLTNCLSGKAVSITGIEKLYFLAKNRNCEVIVEFLASDGTTVLDDYISHTFVDYELVEICFDIDDVLSNYVTPANVYYINVVVHEVAGSNISEEYLYTVDRTIYAQDRTVIFKNQRGGYDVLRCTGSITIEDEFDRTELTPINGVGNPSTLVKRSVINARQQSVQSLSSGWVRKEDMLWLADLFLSDEVYLVDDTNVNRLHHCIVQSTKQGRHRDRVHQYAANFDLVVMEG